MKHFIDLDYSTIAVIVYSEKRIFPKEAEDRYYAIKYNPDEALTHSIELNTLAQTIGRVEMNFERIELIRQQPINTTQVEPTYALSWVTLSKLNKEIEKFKEEYAQRNTEIFLGQW